MIKFNNRGRIIFLWILFLISPVIILLLWEVISIRNYENYKNYTSLTYIEYRDALGELNRPLMVINELYFVKILGGDMIQCSYGNSLRGWVHVFKNR